MTVIEFRPANQNKPKKLTLKEMGLPEIDAVINARSHIIALAMTGDKFIGQGHIDLIPQVEALRTALQIMDWLLHDEDYVA